MQVQAVDGDTGVNNEVYYDIIAGQCLTLFPTIPHCFEFELFYLVLASENVNPRESQQFQVIQKIILCLNLFCF